MPSDPTDTDAVTRGLDQPPYYFVASDPETGKPTFQLTTVMNALRREFLSAYMTVSSNPDNYGQITIKNLPPNSQKEGPKQAFNPMQTDGRVAESRKNLENTANVKFGNLLTLPVGDNGILNVVPMYAEAKGSEATFPRLFRVIVRYNNKVGYAPTVGAALAQVGIDPSTVTQIPGAENAPVQPEQPEQPQQGQTPTPPAGGAQTSPELDAVVKRIDDALTAMQEAMQSGDFTAYGKAQGDLQAATEDYEQLPKG